MNEIWIPIVVAIIMAIPGILTFYNQNRKDSLAAAAQYKEMHQDELTRRREAEAACDEKDERIDQLEKEVRQSRHYIKRLQTQLTYHSIEPLEENGTHYFTSK